MVKVGISMASWSPIASIVYINFLLCLYLHMQGWLGPTDLDM